MGSRVQKADNVTVKKLKCPIDPDHIGMNKGEDGNFLCSVCSTQMIVIEETEVPQSFYTKKEKAKKERVKLDKAKELGDFLVRKEMERKELAKNKKKRLDKP